MAKWPDPDGRPAADVLSDQRERQGEYFRVSRLPAANRSLRAASDQTRRARPTPGGTPTDLTASESPQDGRQPGAGASISPPARPDVSAPPPLVAVSAQTASPGAAPDQTAASTRTSEQPTPAHTTPEAAPSSGDGNGSLGERLARIPRLLLLLLGGVASVLTIAPWRWAWLVCIVLLLILCVLLGDIAVFWPSDASTAARCLVVFSTIAAGVVIGVVIVSGPASGKRPVLNAAISRCVSISAEGDHAAGVNLRCSMEPAWVLPAPPAPPASPVTPPAPAATPIPVRIKVTVPRGGSILFEIGPDSKREHTNPQARLAKHRPHHAHRVATIRAASPAEPETPADNSIGGVKAEETPVAPGTGGTPAPSVPATPVTSQTSASTSAAPSTAAASTARQGSHPD
jgi:hypothetical protein